MKVGEGMKFKGSFIRKTQFGYMVNNRSSWDTLEEAKEWIDLNYSKRI